MKITLLLRKVPLKQIPLLCKYKTRQSPMTILFQELKTDHTPKQQHPRGSFLQLSLEANTPAS